MSSRAPPACSAPAPAPARDRTGSSRSRTRDHDSRSHRDHREKHKRSRSRSRSRERTNDDRRRDRGDTASYDRSLEDHSAKRPEDRSRRDGPESEPTPPSPPRITKISIGFSKPASGPIKMSLGGAGASKATPTQAPKPSVASVFNTSDDEEPEEMPAEARMRMRNIGRETPTSAGPNSFGKTKHGFCDSKKVFERNMKEAMDSSDPTAPKPPQKFPQTIYKLNNS